MAIRFYFDVHVRQAVTEGLRLRGVVYAHQLNVTAGQCIEDLELIAKVGEPEDMANRVEYLPL
jgi:hypothetical protein